MTKAITKEYIDQWKKAKDIAQEYEEKIADRITYIIETWVKTFGGKLDTWYFDGAAEGELGDIYHNTFGDTICNIYIECNKDPKDMVILDKFGKVYKWQSEILMRWLFDEDFEKEIIDGKKKFETKEIERKEKLKLKRAQKTSKDQQLLQQAKNKLSKEELAAIKRAG